MGVPTSPTSLVQGSDRPDAHTCHLYAKKKLFIICRQSIYSPTGYCRARGERSLALHLPPLKNSSTLVSLVCFEGIAVTRALQFKVLSWVMNT